VVTNLLNKALGYMGALVKDGGPSLTRWLALRVTELMSLLVAVMVITECYVTAFKGRGSDAGIVSAIVTISLALITATSLNQNTKLTLDYAPKGDPSKVSTPGATITNGDQSDQPK
jgi:hypothetical protein